MLAVALNNGFEGLGLRMLENPNETCGQRHGNRGFYDVVSYTEEYTDYVVLNPEEFPTLSWQVRYTYSTRCLQ